MDSHIVAQILRRIVIHPRVQYQNFPSLPVERLLGGLPPPVPFPTRRYHSFLFVLDWDHRLPSRHLLGRLHAFYNGRSELRALRDCRLRLSEIQARDRFPEFNVPDFNDLSSDESYIYFCHPDGECIKVQHCSDWSRSINATHQQSALAAVRASKEYRVLKKRYGLRCGPLRLVSWVPPCVSGFELWTIDVRYVITCEGSRVWGKVFLVAPLGDQTGDQTSKVLAIYDFNKRI